MGRRGGRHLTCSDISDRARNYLRGEAKVQQLLSLLLPLLLFASYITNTKQGTDTSPPAHTRNIEGRRGSSCHENSE